MLSYADAVAAVMAKPLATGLAALAAALKRARFTLERVDEQTPFKGPWYAALRAVRFSSVPMGLAWYARKCIRPKTTFSAVTP
ncbi:hypothetical protein [Janthinobacterium sp. RB2R34]|uniref:hypothetical protein n=1 Tax=Janthinobacterium sp. RB2R34 TaxID=3424193 RepID=UPI003F1F1DC1